MRKRPLTSAEWTRVKQFCRGREKSRKVAVVKDAQLLRRDLMREMQYLWSECRKIQIVENGGHLTQTAAGVRITEAPRPADEDALTHAGG